MFVGVGASRVRDLFDKAKKKHLLSSLRDEIDAIGRKESTGKKWWKRRKRANIEPFVGRNQMSLI